MSDTIRNLVRAYASAIAGANMAGTNGAFEKHMDESERIMQQILSYYQPCPEGSVTATREEYDTLTDIAMIVYHFQNDLKGAIPAAELAKLKMYLAKWYETLPEGE